jgi:lipid-A-disaccharide synthase
MIVILPFEKEFYAERGVAVEFVGHPLLDVAKPRRSREETRRALGLSGESPLVGLLPGSRVQEVERHLALFLEARRRAEAQLGRPLAAAVGRAPTVPEERLRAGIGEQRVAVTDETYDLMAAADLLLVASGTATLEAACLGTPMVVVYRTSALSFALGRLLVRVPHIALANLVAGARVVPELLQAEATPDAIAREAVSLLSDDARRAAVRAGFARVRERLGEPGAAGRAAEIVLRLARGGPRR